MVNRPRRRQGLFVFALWLAIVGVTGVAAWVLVPIAWPHRWIAITATTLVMALALPLGAFLAFVRGLD
jgi:TRAP-type C4-dicarboxylate transport system permease small subunit